MKLQRVLAILALSAVAGPVAAGEARLAFGGWRYDLDGTANDAGTVYDFDRDLGVRGRGRQVLELAWDTGPGGWPDLVLGYAEIGAAGSRTYDNLPPLPGQQTLETSADNDDIDLTARYPLLRGPLSVAAGLTLKRLSGTIVIDDSNQPQPSRQDFDEIIPQGHVHLRWDFSRLLALAATGQGVEYQGDRAVEWRALAELRLFDPVRVEFGWQEKRYELTTGDYGLDARLRGALLRVGVAFRP